MSSIASILLLVVVSALLVVTGLKKQPGIGVMGAIILIALALWWRGGNLLDLGFGPPPHWGRTLWLGFWLGLAIQLVAIVLIAPLSEMITQTRHDHSIVESVKGNWRALLQWLLVVWVLVAFLEEGLYRGFLMTEIARVVGTGSGALVLNILLTSAVFGLSHGYQGRAGILSTGLIGILLGGIFVWSDFNLWLAIWTHGFIDTIGLGLIAVDGEQYIRQKLWRLVS